MSPSRVRTAADIYALVGGAPEDAVHAVHLDGSGRVLGISQGEAPASTRDFMRDAVTLGSAAIVVAHLIGELAPSPIEAQRAACAEIVAAARSLGIKLLDYLLFGTDDFCSFRAHGLL